MTEEISTTQKSFEIVSRVWCLLRDLRWLFNQNTSTRFVDIFLCLLGTLLDKKNCLDQIGKVAQVVPVVVFYWLQL